ncbi:hypothetical protein D3C76_1057210 [compost metagenome]
MLGVLAIAVHVDGQRFIAQGRQVAGAALGIVVQAPPFMHHHHARALALGGVVVGVVADQALAVGVLVGDLTGLHRRLGQAGGTDQGQSEQTTHGRTPYLQSVLHSVQLFSRGSAWVQRRFRTACLL